MQQTGRVHEILFKGRAYATSFLIMFHTSYLGVVLHASSLKRVLFSISFLGDTLRLNANTLFFTMFHTSYLGVVLHASVFSNRVLFSVSFLGDTLRFRANTLFFTMFHTTSYLGVVLQASVFFNRVLFNISFLGDTCAYTHTFYFDHVPYFSPQDCAS